MFAVLGLLLILLTLLDIFWTTMGEGGGPLIRFIARRLWRGFLFIHRSGRYRLTAVAGISIVLIAVMLWLLLLWLGWTLVFSADGPSGGLLGKILFYRTHAFRPRRG